MSEILLLRQGEAVMQAESEEADRLVRSLLPRYACDFVVANMPDGCWCRLPWNWQNEINEPVQLRYGRPPSDLKGPVGVSLKTLRRLAL